MGVFSEMNWDLNEQPEAGEQSDGGAFMLGETAKEASATEKETFEDDARQQAEADTAKAALSMLNQTDALPEGDAKADAQAKSDDQKKKEHEAAEAKRKAEWEAKQAKKKAAFEKALQELLAMSGQPRSRTPQNPARLQ